VTSPSERTGDVDSGPGATGPFDAPPAPKTDLDALAARLHGADAVALVHVGDRFDDDLRYLTRFSGPDRDYAFVLVEDRAVLCAPALFDEQAEREFLAAGPDGETIDREVRTEGTGDPAGARAAAALDDLLDGPGTVLVPRHLPHDAAVYLERAGYDIASTRAIAEARAKKTDAELACLRFAQRAAARGMTRAEAILEAATRGGGGDGDGTGDEGGTGDETALRWEGAPLTTERLRREVNAELARAGATDAGNTVIGAGPTCADLHFAGDAPIRAGETVLLDISPRGPHGYYGDLSRTFVVDGDGGWERRAHVAVEAARRAALKTLEPGVPAGRVHEETAAEIAAYGFEIGRTDRGFTHGTGHGVGLSLHEAPSLRSDAPLEPGTVVTIEPGVYDPEIGGVRIEDLVVVTADGYELLAEYPRSLAPGAEYRSRE
jgi:Xaa-Pro aminopeptidase